ncbi:hypothetical protein CL618_00305 [archaeon]|nr:hypothetical protein [archaeon]
MVENLEGEVDELFDDPEQVFSDIFKVDGIFYPEKVEDQSLTKYEETREKYGRRISLRDPE